MQGDHIGACKQRVKRGIFGQRAAGAAFIFVISDHIHTKRPCNTPGRLSDPSKADNPHRLARQLDQRVIPKTPVGILFPAAGVDGVAVMSDMVADFKQHGNCKLADSRRSICRDVADRDPAFTRRGYVNYIVTCRQNADKL